MPQLSRPPLHGKDLEKLQLAFEAEELAAIYKLGSDRQGSEFIVADLLLGLQQAQERLEHLEEAGLSDHRFQYRIPIKPSAAAQDDQRMREHPCHGDRRHQPFPHHG